MIHQLIFAAPKPGMTEKDFQNYWLNIHAVQFASKIPEIQKYSVDTRVVIDDIPQLSARWGGTAEIWFDSPEACLRSLQSSEFIDGARPDEPRWAAFWLTIAMNTEPISIIEGPPVSVKDKEVQVFILIKRHSGIELPTFRNAITQISSFKAHSIPKTVRFTLGFTTDDAYDIGESLLDAVLQLSFPDKNLAHDALHSSSFQDLYTDIQQQAQQRYIHIFVAEQNWIII